VQARRTVIPPSSSAADDPLCWQPAATSRDATSAASIAASVCARAASGPLCGAEHCACQTDFGQ
jgi:hypothetical protein